MNSGIYSLVAINPDGTRNYIKEYSRVSLYSIDGYTTWYSTIENLKRALGVDNNSKLVIVYNRNGEHQEPVLLSDYSFLIKYFNPNTSEIYEGDATEEIYQLVEKGLVNIKADSFVLPYIIKRGLLPKSLIENLKGCLEENSESIIKFFDNIVKYKYLRDFVYSMRQAYIQHLNNLTKYPNYNYIKGFNPNDQDNPETAPYEFITNEDFDNKRKRGV